MIRAAPAATLLVLACCAQAAGQTLTLDVPREDLAARAERASGGDEAALAQLYNVNSVEGVSVQPGVALEGASGPQLDARLAELARSARAAADDTLLSADEARAAAAEVASGSEPESPATAEGDSSIWPDLPAWLGVGLAVLAILVGAAIARAVARRRIVERQAAAAAGKDPKQPGARRLDHEAAEAERRGDYANAVRLRFRAGLERLHAAGAVRLRPTLTARSAAREIRSPTLAALAGDFDEIVFGGRVAERGDAESARSRWRDLLREVGA